MAEAVNAIASLLWPLLVLSALLLFHKPVSRLLRNADVTIEVGGQKLTIKQLSDQQGQLINDLQRQVAQLSQQITEFSDRGQDAGGVVSNLDIDTTPLAVSQAVLWVDDFPENNALIIDQLRRNGVRVDLAHSTLEGLSLFGRKRYGIVLSDMGRREDGDDVSDAGLRLLRAVREYDPAIPFVIYCSARAARTFGERALAEGATAITASATVLVEQLSVAGIGQ
jgi:CheY-like chemotaxis protein